MNKWSPKAIPTSTSLLDGASKNTNSIDMKIVLKVTDVWVPLGFFENFSQFLLWYQEARRIEETYIAVVRPFVWTECYPCPLSVNSQQQSFILNALL